MSKMSDGDQVQPAHVLQEQGQSILDLRLPDRHVTADGVHVQRPVGPDDAELCGQRSFADIGRIHRGLERHRRRQAPGRQQRRPGAVAEGR